MARFEKQAATLILALALVPVVTGLDFQIGINSEADVSTVNPQYDNSTQGVHNYNVSVENPASIGCSYHLIGRFEYKNRTEVVRSQSYGLWSGSTETARLQFVPLNYTGEVDADIDVGYCSHQKNVTSYRFNVTEETVAESRFESETLEADENSAEISIKVENGRLVPIDTPGYWNVASAEIVNGTSSLSYDAPLYQPRDIEYAVIDEGGEIIGRTTVNTTSPEKTWRDKLRQNPWTVFALLLALSLVGNVYLLRKRLIPEILREKISDIEFGDRSVRK